MPGLRELGQDRLEVDPASQCPAAAPEIVEAANAAPVATALIAAAPADPAPQDEPAAAPPQGETVTQALHAWARAWSTKDFPAYRGFYGGGFVPENGQPRERWAETRAARLAKPGVIAVGIDDLMVASPEADRATTEFRQSYTSADYRDVTYKRIDWVREDGHWKIVREYAPR